MARVSLGSHFGRVTVIIPSPTPTSGTSNNEHEDEEPQDRDGDSAHHDSDDSDSDDNDSDDKEPRGRKSRGRESQDGMGSHEVDSSRYGPTGMVTVTSYASPGENTNSTQIHPMPAPTYPPLTTTFTPDPWCYSLFASCNNNTGACHGTIFAKALCYIEGTLTMRSSPSCYPGTFLPTNSPPTYSPGHFCPAGMTTVASVSIGDVAWCCPDGLTLEEDYLCRRTTAQWAYTSTGSLGCAEKVIDNTGTPPVVQVAATPVVLKGVPNNDPKGVPRNDSKGVSTAVEAGIILGSILGVAFLSSLAIIYVLRVRKAKVIKKAQAEKAPEAEMDEYTGKPELEGSTSYVYTTKAELDASATRAELEGTLVEYHGDDGIYVLKPELEGTAGLERNRGVYVRNKPELEAVSKLDTSSAEQLVSGLEEVSNPCVPTAEQHPAELETMAVKAKGRTSALEE